MATILSRDPSFDMSRLLAGVKKDAPLVGSAHPRGGGWWCRPVLTVVCAQTQTRAHTSNTHTHTHTHTHARTHARTHPPLQVVKAYLTHDLATLGQHCGPELMERFAGIFRHFQAEVRRARR
jgi:hypothetical protein